MIITCPNCATGYSVNADVFPVTGRTVKCARCAQTWYALPAEELPDTPAMEESVAEETDNVAATDTPADTDSSPVAARGDAGPEVSDGLDDLDWEEGGSPAETENLPAEVSAEIDIEIVEDDTEEAVMTAEEVFGPTGDKDNFSNDGSDGEAEADPDSGQGASIVDDGEEETGAEDPAGDGAENVVSIEAASRARQAAMRFRSRLKNKQPVSLAHRIKAASVGGMLAILVAGVSYREDIVRSVPSMAGLYALAGFEVNLRGLVFEVLEPVQEMEHGLPVLKVSGGIRNVSDDAKEVPPVRLSLTSPSGQEIYFWTIWPETEVLAPGETTDFTSVLSAPPRAATGIAARFVDPEGVHAGPNKQGKT